MCDHTLPHVQQHQTLPPRSGGIRHCHVSHGSRSRLPAQEGSGAAMCPKALDPASLLRRALAPPHVPCLLTPPPRSGGIWRYHVSRGYLLEMNKEVFGCNG
jgi:hypothetical protein